MQKKLTYKNKILIALIINSIIFLMEIYALFLSVRRHGIKVFQYYTEICNYFTLIASALFIVFSALVLYKNKSIPKVITLFRFTSTTCLTITILVVLLVLIPMFPESLVFMLFKDSNLYQHLLCPILSIISFLVFENNTNLNKRSIIYAVAPTLYYGITIVVLNILRVITGPYPFFYIYDTPWYFSTSILVIILFSSILITIGLYYIYNREYFKSDKLEKIKKSTIEVNT